MFLVFYFMYDKFTFEEYDKITSRLKNKSTNLVFSDFYNNNNVPNKYFILRHDIDYCLTSAYNLAYFESKKGLRASYFLLLSSNNYNLLSEESRDIPKKLTDLGHEVGLHYDIMAISKDNNENKRESLLLEIEILSNLTGKDIKSIAMHNPSIYGKDIFANEKNFINVYDDKFTKEIKYFSDSCGAWRDEAYHSFKSSIIPDRLQLLTHPFFWGKNMGDRWKRLNDFIKCKKSKINIYNERLKSNWQKHEGLKEHQKRNN